MSSLRKTYNLVIIFNMYPPFFLNITMLWINTTQNAKSRICVAFSRRNMYSICQFAQWSNYICVYIDLFILKNMGAAIIDFRVCPPLVKCQNIMFSGFIDTLMYGFSSTGVTIYCYFGLKFNDNTCCEVIYKRRYNNNDIMTTNKLPGMYFFFN